MAEKNVIQLGTTSTTSGSYFEITIPNGIGGYISKKISFAVIADAVNLDNAKNKGYYVDEAALIAAYPVGENGWFAINGDTDTVWIWDSDASAWIDTTNSGLVISVNGQTGVVVLEAIDISFASAAGLSATNVRDGIDELKAYIDATLAGAGGIFVNQSRTNSDEAITAGSNVITFSDPLLTADYSLIIQDNDGVGLDTENIVKTVNSFTITSLGTGTIDYIAIAKTTTGVDFEANSIGYDNTISGLAADNLQDSTDELAARTKRHTQSFVSGDLVAGVLSITHNFNNIRPSTIIVYNNNEEEVNKTNYIYKGLTTSVGQISFFLPITGTWNVLLTY